MRALPAALSTLVASFAIFAGLEATSPWAVDGPGMNVFRTRADLQILRQAVLYYQKEHGSLPNSLEQLVPTSLERLPKDRWGTAYVYRLDASRKAFSLHSMGRDTVDQAGGGDDIVESEKESDCTVYRANCLGEQLQDIARLASALVFVLSLPVSIGLLGQHLWQRWHAKRAT